MLPGTFAGILTMVIGVGPWSLFDARWRVGVVALLVTGLTVVACGDRGVRLRHAEAVRRSR